MRKATTCLLCTSVALLTYTCTLLPSHFSSYSYAWHAAPPDQSIFSPSNTELSLHSALPDFDGDELNWQLDPNLGAAPAAVIETMAGQAPLSWISGSFPAWTNNSLAAVRWSDYNELEYSFAETTPDSSVPGFSARLDETEYMREFTRIAKANGVRPTLAVGGWTGSRFFSSAAGSHSNRTSFASALVNCAAEHGFEGITLSWQTPGTPGVGCNEYSVADPENLLALVKVAVRKLLGAHLKFSAAVPLSGFVDSAGDSLLDYTELALNLDKVIVEAFDVVGASDQTGANAPLSSACAPESQPGSVTSAYEYWTSAGVPASKLILGLAASGTVYKLLDKGLVRTQNGPIPSYVYQLKSEIPVQAGPEDERGGIDICGDETDYSSVYTYADLVAADFIDEQGQARQENGWARYFDKCSATPFLYNHGRDLFITYDDPTSVAIKAYWAREHGMAGVKIYDQAGDFQGQLALAARKQLEQTVGSEFGVDVDLGRQLIG